MKGMGRFRSAAFALVLVTLSVFGRWSAREQIINQMNTGNQFNLKGKFVLRAQPGQIKGKVLTVVLTGQINGEEIKTFKLQMRHTQRGVNALREGKSIECRMIWLRGRELLKYHE